jgi:hypothetical protein
MQAQRRGISCELFDALIEFGDIKQNGSVDIFYFSKKSRERAKGNMSPKIYRALVDKMSKYAVLNSDTVITVGHRHKRIKRK